VLGLTHQPLWVDEIITLRTASIGEPFRLADVLINPQGPLPHVLLRLWTAVMGSGDLALRSWAVAAGILGLALAVVAYRRACPRAALAATWFLALSPFHIWYSQEVRNYVFLLAVSALVLWTLIRAVNRPSARAWIWHGVSLAALMLCNLSGVFLLAAAVAALVALSPCLWAEYGGHLHWAAVTGGPGAVPIRGSLTFHPIALPFTFSAFVGGFGLGPPLRELHGDLTPRLFLPHLPWLLPAALATLGLVAAAASRLREPRVRLLFWWSFLPALLVAGVALVGLKAFNPRYAAVSQPIFLLLLAEGLSVLWSRRRRLAGAAALCLLVPMLVAVGRQGLDSRYGREDFRGAGAFLERAAQRGDLLLQQGVNGPLERYYSGPAEIDTFFPVYFEAGDGGEARLSSMTEGRRRVWWVGSRLWFEDPEGKLVDLLESRARPLSGWKGAGVEVRGFEFGPEAP